MSRTISMAVAAALALASVMLPSSLRAAVVEEVILTLAPAESVVTGQASLSVPSGAADLRLELDDAFTLTAVRVGDRALAPPRDPGGGRFVLPGEGPWTVEVEWRGVAPPPGPPAVAPEGSYLPADVAWFPRAGDDRPRRLSVRTPPGHRAAATGALLEETVTADGAVAVFAPYAGEPPSVFAGPYQVAERKVGPLRLRTYFPEGAAGLAEAYLDDTAAHIERFSRLIGPYPYDTFFVVAAPYPVGWGFPGLTYVSEKILAQPFMRARSLPHEIVHSWWGNAVTPDYSSGNWAEGLTTYMADYGLAPDQAAKRRMRLAWLRDIAALPAERDRPVTAFTSKSHGADQVIGYNKPAFIFHMLERGLGTEALHRGLGRFYAAHRGGTASWSDLRAALEAESGEDLGRFFDQWLTRPGVPSLTLERAQRDPGAVTVVVAQDEPPYALRLPVTARTPAGDVTQVVPIAGPRSTIAVAVDDPVEAVALDPDYHVLRRLSPQETPPILRDVTLAAEPTVLLPTDPAAREAGQELALRLFGQPVAGVTVEGAIVGDGPLLVVAVEGEDSPLAALGAAEAVPPMLEDRGTARVWAWRLPGDRPVLVVQADDAEALSALIRPLPHYGQDSWLVFDGPKMTDRGLWDPPAQPLRKVFR